MQKLLQGHTGLRAIGESRRAATAVGDVVVVVSFWWWRWRSFSCGACLALQIIVVVPGAAVAARSVLFGCCSVAFDLDQAGVVVLSQ